MNHRLILALGFLPLTFACDESGSGGEGGSSGGGASKSFFLPTAEPDNTSAPTVEVDAAGNLHAVYPAYAGGNAYYAFCDEACSKPEDVQVVELETEGTVANAMIALDAEGRPQVLLATFQYLYYASCTGDCTARASWTVTKILDHGSDQDVTGEAFALDPQGRPRFILHTYVAFLGVGQQPPETFYAVCDADCHDSASWAMHSISDQIWKFSHLRFDAQGRPRLATVAMIEDETGASLDMAAYVECSGGCELAENWIGTGIMPAFSSAYDAVTIDPEVSLALTSEGKPRMLVLGKDEAEERNVTYFACDEDCTGEGWLGTILSTGSELGAGLDLALDADDHPRFAYTYDYSIGLASCDADQCANADSPWSLDKVENSSELPPDEIFLWPGCYVGAWFFHSPSVALTPEGEARVGYQARDISGGWPTPDPTEPDCSAGTDMSWSRLTKMGKVVAD